MLKFSRFGGCERALAYWNDPFPIPCRMGASAWFALVVLPAQGKTALPRLVANQPRWHIRTLAASAGRTASALAEGPALGQGLPRGRPAGSGPGAGGGLRQRSASSSLARALRLIKPAPGCSLFLLRHQAGLADGSGCWSLALGARRQQSRLGWDLAGGARAGNFS